MGENPVKETIQLKEYGRSNLYLELKTNGTALYIDEDETIEKLKYTWDADTKTIRMRLEKTSYVGELLTYDESLSKIKEAYTVENMRESLKNSYNKEKDKEEFKEKYPDCDTYEEYEAVTLEENGYKSFDDYIEYINRIEESILKAQFSAQVTYSYKITDGEMTLNEKFTGVKNLIKSECKFYDSSDDTEASIYYFYAHIDVNKYDVRYQYGGYLDTEKRTIDFEKYVGDKAVGNVKGSYTENISAKTVTIKCEGKEYVCEFEGQKFVQE